MMSYARFVHGDDSIYGPFDLLISSHWLAESDFSLFLIFTKEVPSMINNLPAGDAQVKILDDFSGNWICLTKSSSDQDGKRAEVIVKTGIRM